MRTLDEMKAMALTRLGNIHLGDIQVNSIYDTAINMEIDGFEAGFVLEEFAGGLVRSAYFFVGWQEVPLSDAELEVVADVIYPLNTSL